MYMRVVRGLDPELFAQEFNKVSEGFKNLQVRFIDDLTAYVYGEEATPKWEQPDPAPEPDWKSRKCAECSYYEWGKMCLQGEKNRHPGDCACAVFTSEETTDEVIANLKSQIKAKRTTAA